MAALEEDQDDVVINPATMLLRDSDDSDEVKMAESEQLRQHSLPSIDSTIVTRQLPSQGLSFQLWPAATTLLTLLDDHRRDPTTSPLGPTLSALESGRRLKILELGSGTGLVGIAAAATLGACVTVTDLPHVVDNLKFNAELNAAALGGSGGSVRVAALRWGEAEDAEAIGREFDIVLASDVVYHDHLYEPLLKTLSFLLLGEGGVVFVMAHLRRWKKESAFFKRARKLFEVEVLHVDRPCQGSRVGVTVYRFTGKPSVGERSIFHLCNTNQIKTILCFQILYNNQNSQLSHNVQRVLSVAHQKFTVKLSMVGVPAQSSPSPPLQPTDEVNAHIPVFASQSQRKRSFYPN